MISVLSDDRASSCYLEEILSHAGLTWRRMIDQELGGEGLKEHVIVVAGRVAISESAGAWLSTFVQQGGALVAVGGTFGLDDLLAARGSGPLSEGYLALEPDHPIAEGLTSSLHVFGGVDLRAQGGTSLGRVRDIHHELTSTDAVIVNRAGRGVTVAIAPDIPGSVLYIQQGRAIHADGSPAPDGSAPIDDQILKTDDGVVLSWAFDREQSVLDRPEPDCPGKHPAYPDGDTPWFAQAVADDLRELLVRAICWAAATSAQPLALLWYWPRGLQGIGLISHDSDLNIDDSARTTLQVLGELDIRSTWCTMWGPNWPGRYTSQTYSLVKDAGHEVALHYNGLPEDGGAWGEEHLISQAAWLRQEAGVARITSNKNHYLRWEGDVDCFRWLESEGIESDQSKGPSKRGNVGYPHGSCQPWFPYDAEQERFLNVLEIPVQTQDLWLTAPYAIAGPIIHQALKQHGVAHFLFHQRHIHQRPEVAAALRQVVADGRSCRLEWWTGTEINAWERLRRKIRVTCEQINTGCFRLHATTPTPAPGAWLVLLLPADIAFATGTATYGGRPAPVELAQCHQVQALYVEVDLPSGDTSIEVSLSE